MTNMDFFDIDPTGIGILLATATFLLTVVADAPHRLLCQVLLGAVANSVLLTLFSPVDAISYWVALVAANLFSDWLHRRDVARSELEMAAWRVSNGLPDPPVHYPTPAKALQG